MASSIGSGIDNPNFSIVLTYLYFAYLSIYKVRLVLTSELNILVSY